MNNCVDCVYFIAEYGKHLKGCYLFNYKLTLDTDEKCDKFIPTGGENMKQTKEQLIAEIEQLRVQLAGCGVAALGFIRGKSLAKAGDYGWSPAYQDVVNLRKRYNALERKVK